MPELNADFSVSWTDKNYLSNPMSPLVNITDFTHSNS